MHYFLSITNYNSYWVTFMAYNYIREPLQVAEADRLCQSCETMQEKLIISGFGSNGTANPLKDLITTGKTL